VQGGRAAPQLLYVWVPSGAGPPAGGWGAQGAARAEAACGGCQGLCPGERYGQDVAASSVERPYQCPYAFYCFFFTVLSLQLKDLLGVLMSSSDCPGSLRPPLLTSDVNNWQCVCVCCCCCCCCCRPCRPHPAGAAVSGPHL
jgi:hypothetical protein